MRKVLAFLIGVVGLGFTIGYLPMQRCSGLGDHGEWTSRTVCTDVGYYPITESITMMDRNRRSFHINHMRVGLTLIGVIVVSILLGVNYKKPSKS